MGSISQWVLCMGHIKDMGKNAKHICGSANAFDSNSKEFRGNKIHKDIKIHGKLFTINFHFWENKKLFIFMIWGLMEISGNP